MTTPIKMLLTAGLLCGAAPMALAQQAQNEESCQRLQQLTTQNAERFRDEWVREATGVYRADDRAECARYVTQGERAARQLDRREAAGQQQAGQASSQGAEAGSRIVVTQPEPSVDVGQRAPEIMVNQPQPTISVNQPQPEILVRQAQPTVRVQMPQPTITINQPQPEIIVRMPEPDVAFNVPEPQIEVRQRQPEVEVQQGQPQVRVDMQEPEVNVAERGEAQVQVERGQPVIRRTNEDVQPRVNIEQAEPNVRYEAAEPNIEFENQGEPNVRFTSSGEPNIRVERMGEAGNRQGNEAGNRQGNAAAQQANRNAQAQQAAGQDDERTGSIGNAQRLSPAARERLGLADENEPSMSMVSSQVGDLVDRDVVNARGQELGSVERLVMRNDRAYVVLSHGGFLGLGEREVALPLDRLSLSPQGRDELVVRGLSEADMDELPRFDMNTARPIGSTQSVDISQG